MKDISYKLLHEDYEEVFFFSLSLAIFISFEKKKFQFYAAEVAEGRWRWDWGCVDCSEITGLELGSITFSDKVSGLPGASELSKHYLKVITQMNNETWSDGVEKDFLKDVSNYRTVSTATVYGQKSTNVWMAE